jgi:hypothetical protein
VVYTNHVIDLFYLVGVYILSGNPEHVAVYTNHGIYLFYLVVFHIPSGIPEHVVVYTNGIYLFYLVGVYILADTAVLYKLLNYIYRCLHTIR